MWGFIFPNTNFSCPSEGFPGSVRAGSWEKEPSAFCWLISVPQPAKVLLLGIIGIHAGKASVARVRGASPAQPHGVQTDLERASSEFQRALAPVCCELHQKCSLGQECLQFFMMFILNSLTFPVSLEAGDAQHCSFRCAELSH